MNFTLLDQTMRANGQSTTTARRQVYAALYEQEPMNMHKLVQRCRPIDRSSVYRTVALFERLGIVQRLQTGWKYKLELAGNYHEHHHHATCLGCSQTFVVPEDAALEEDLQRVARKLSFHLERHQLELQGYCASCQDKSV